MNDDQLRELLREMRDEPLPADSLARVREGVAARVERKSGGAWRWGLFAATFVAVVLVAVIGLPRPEIAPPPAPAPVAVPIEAPRLEPPKPRVISKARPKPVVKPQPEPEVVFRIQTEDPEVVIWLSN